MVSFELCCTILPLIGRRSFNYVIKQIYICYSYELCEKANIKIVQIITPILTISTVVTLLYYFGNKVAKSS